MQDEALAGPPDSEPFLVAGGLHVTNRVQLELMTAVLARGVPFRFQALGFSMAPFIQHGDVLTVTPVAGRSPRIGEVVAFTHPISGRLVVHRVIARCADELIVRGDNRPEADPAVSRERLLGVVVRVEREGRVVRLGTGPERGAIAWLSARAWLVPARRLLRLPLRPIGALLRRARRLAKVRAWLTALRPPFKIVEAEPADLIAVAALVGIVGDAEPLRQKLGVTTYVARNGERVLGMVQLVRHSPEDFPYVGYWGYGLTIDGRYRGAGLGEALGRRAIDQALAEGATELHLNVFADNAPATALYHKLGFYRVALPGLEERLAAAAEPSGRRMVTMRKDLRRG